jgi:hypothetical protein
MWQWSLAFAFEESARVQVEFAVAAALLIVAILAGVRLVGQANNNSTNQANNMLTGS